MSDNTKYRTHQEITWAEGHDPVARYVVCAANRFGDLVICGARHYDSVMCRVIKELGGMEAVHDGLERDDIEQGFIDQYGAFMSRDEAAFVVVSNKQAIAEPEQAELGRLISENIY